MLNNNVAVEILRFFDDEKLSRDLTLYIQKIYPNMTNRQIQKVKHACLMVGLIKLTSGKTANTSYKMTEVGKKFLNNYNVRE